MTCASGSSVCRIWRSVSGDQETSGSSTDRLFFSNSCSNWRAGSAVAPVPRRAARLGLVPAASARARCRKRDGQDRQQKAGCQQDRTVRRQCLQKIGIERHVTYWSRHVATCAFDARRCFLAHSCRRRPVAGRGSMSETSCRRDGFPQNALRERRSGTHDQRHQPFVAVSRDRPTTRSPTRSNDRSTAGVADAEPADGEIVDADRQARPVDLDFAVHSRRSPGRGRPASA